MSQTQAGARCKSTKLRHEQLQAYKTLYPTAYSFVRCSRASLRSLRFRRVSLVVILTLERFDFLLREYLGLSVSLNFHSWCILDLTPESLPHLLHCCIRRGYFLTRWKARELKPRYRSCISKAIALLTRL